jgi:NAD(P)H dehydrogenase (quinone)
LVDQDVDVRVADFDDRDLLRSAFAGADTVFINATFFGTVTALRQQRVANAIDATQEAGVPRVIMTSWPDLEHCDLAAIADYRASEERLRSTSSDWTILRLGYGIADAVARDVKWGVRDGRVVAPAASAIIRPVAVADLVEASATVLLGEGHSREILEIRTSSNGHRKPLRTRSWHAPTAHHADRVKPNHRWLVATRPKNVGKVWESGTNSAPDQHF